MYKIISFSVWGNSDKYLNGCFENVRLAKEIYPGWKTRFYCDSSMSHDFIVSLGEAGAEIVETKVNENTWEGLFWRFYPAYEKNVDVFISRDIDSRLNPREKAAVDEWLSSDKQIHCMRDHVEHNVPILGGMWGCRGRILRDLRNKIDMWGKYDYKGSDQDFLRINVWDQFVNKVLAHDRYYNGLTIENGEHKEGYISSYVPYVYDPYVDPLTDPYYDPDAKAPDYVYDPIKFFGQHDIRPFPKHDAMNYGTHVGEIIS